MRNRFRITAKSNIRFKSIKPYIGNEFFYDFEKKSYNKNWLMVGIDLQKKRYGVPSIYYKYVTDFDWKTSNLYVQPKIHKNNTIIEKIKISKVLILKWNPPTI